MNKKLQTLKLHAIWLGALLAPCLASAQEAAPRWQVKLGYNLIDPKVSSGDLSAPSLPGTKVDVHQDESVIVTLGYAFTTHVSAEFFAGLPYRHNIVGDGAIKGVGKLGDTKQISPTLMLQYRFFTPQDQVRPYVGAGVTYAYFYDERGSNVLTSMTNPGGEATLNNIDGALGASMLAGIQGNLSERWFIDVGLVKTLVKTTSHLSTGQHIDIHLDPVSTNLSLGYRF